MAAEKANAAAEATPASAAASDSASSEGSNSASPSGKLSQISRSVFGYFRLLFYANPSKTDLALLLSGTVFSCAAGIPFPILGILFGQLIDDLNGATCNTDASVSPDQYQQAVNQKVLLVMAMALTQFACIWIYTVSFNLFGDRLAHRVRERYFRSLLRQEVSFFDKLPAGEVSSRLSSDIATIQGGTSQKVGVYLGSMAMFLASYIIAFVKDARLAGILVCLIPAFMLMAYVGGHYVGKFSGVVSTHVAEASAVAMESLSNVMVVHAFRANGRMEARFASKLAGARTSGIKKAFTSAVQAGLLYFIAYAACGMAYWQGSQTIADVVAGITSGVSVGTIYTIIFLLVDASIILSQVSPFLQIFGAAAQALGKLEADMERRSRIDGTVDPDGGDDAGNDLDLASFRGDMRMQNVEFTYPARPDVPVIRDVSLHFEAGKHTAIVGLSGSGKSTVAGLLTRRYDPDGGSRSVDGRPLPEVNVRRLRSCVGLVQQDPTLLDRSVLENIALGLVNSSRPEHAPLQEVLMGTALAEVARDVREGGQDLESAAASRGAVVQELVRMVQSATEVADARVFLGGLEHGLATGVGSNGDLLSGGQKQRVALARAMVKDPRVLVLDEATSSLDSASEQRIQAAIQRVSAGRTVVSIAHRLAAIKTADKIVVMRNGRVMEQGSHGELMAKDADYAALVRLQSVGSGEETASERTVATSLQDANEKKRSEGEVEGEKKGMEEDGGGEKGGVVAGEKEGAAAAAAAAGTTAGALVKGEKAPPRSSWATLRSFYTTSRPWLLWLAVAFFASMVVGGTYSGSAQIFGHTIGAISPCNTPEAIRAAGSFFGLMFFVLAVAEFFANLISWAAFGYVAERVLYAIRVLAFRSLFQQDLQWHQSEGRTPSGLLAFITTDSASVGGLTGSIMGTLFSIIVNFLVAVIMAHIVAWKIAVVCLATVPLMLGSGFMQLHILARFAEKHDKAFERSVSITVEAVGSIQTVAALSLEREVLATYRRSLAAPKREMTLSSVWANLFLAFAFSIANLIYALIYWWGTKQIVAGVYTQTQFFIVLIALLVSAQIWGQFFTLAPEVTRAARAAGRIFDLIDLGDSQTLRDDDHHHGKPHADSDPEAAIQSTTAPSGTTAAGAAISFKQVAFSYPSRPGRQVLSGLDLDIRPGQFCALVGPSGAGKSTVISLLERMYPVTSGAIEVDGQDISARRDAAFRDFTGLVPQDSVLFDGTVRSNVALGAHPDVDPSDADIERACRLANIHDTIAALPDGYDTQCGPGGGRLSGGQRQRLAIARALVRRPRLLLLDESTSALDAESERLLQDGLEGATRGITVVAIAHRLRTIRRADVIFLIEDGRCVDRGSHEELLARSESYRVNVLHQTLDG